MLINPLVSFQDIELDLANSLLIDWAHKMGPLRRGNQSAVCHALFHNDKPIALTTASTIINPCLAVPGGNFTRHNTIELSRLCACRPGLCRIAVRIWREFVFPALGYAWACSYQDADLHRGHTYRFDGWTRAAFSHSGTDRRTNRLGRDKWIWIWPGLTNKSGDAAVNQRP